MLDTSNLRKDKARATRLLCVAALFANRAPVNAAVKNPDTYVHLTVGDIRSLDPAWLYDEATHLIEMNVYETLFFPDQSSANRLLPLIAETVPSNSNHLISPDGRTYTIPIRQGVRFHDGTQLSAEDVRYSLMRIMLQDHEDGPSRLLLEPFFGIYSTRDEKGNILPGIFERVNRAIRVDGHNIVITLDKPFIPLLPILARYGQIVSKNWAIKQGDWDGKKESWALYNNQNLQDSPLFIREDGTGPFKLERWDRTAKSVVLVRNDDYWRQPAKLKRVIIRAVEEAQTRKIMILAGDADSIVAGTAMQAELKNTSGIQLIDNLPSLDLKPMVFFTFKLNTEGNRFVGSGHLDGNGIPPDFFADHDVRQAFAFSFDYQRFIRDAMQGRGRQAQGCIPTALLPPKPGRQFRTLDLAKAAEYFRKAFAGQVWQKGFHLTLVYNTGNDINNNVCQIFKKNIETLNPKFHLDIQGLAWPSYLDGMNNYKFPLYIIGWAGIYADPHSQAYGVHSDPHVPGGYENDEVNRIIDTAVRELNPIKRTTLYQKLLDVEYQDVPRIEILEPVKLRIQRSWVKGWYHNPVLPDGGYFYAIYKKE